MFLLLHACWVRKAIIEGKKPLELSFLGYCLEWFVRYQALYSRLMLHSLRCFPSIASEYDFERTKIIEYRRQVFLVLWSNCDMISKIFGLLVFVLSVLRNTHDEQKFDKARRMMATINNHPFSQKYPPYWSIYVYIMHVLRNITWQTEQSAYWLPCELVFCNGFLNSRQLCNSRIWRGRQWAKT